MDKREELMKEMRLYDLMGWGQIIKDVEMFVKDLGLYLGVKGEPYTQKPTQL